MDPWWANLWWNGFWQYSSSGWRTFKWRRSFRAFKVKSNTCQYVHSHLVFKHWFNTFTTTYFLKLRVAFMAPIGTMVAADTFSATWVCQVGLLPSKDSEWSLESDWLCRFLYLFNNISAIKWWGYPQIDVFTDRSNSKCPSFCTREGTDPLSLGDSLHLDWSSLFLYLFPPLPLLPWVLHKLQSQLAHRILLAPWWPCQNWFPLLLQLSRRTFIRLWEAPDLLLLEFQGIHHHNIRSLAVITWRIGL